MEGSSGQGALVQQQQPGPARPRLLLETAATRTRMQPTSNAILWVRHSQHSPSHSTKLSRGSTGSPCPCHARWLMIRGFASLSSRSALCKVPKDLQRNRHVSPPRRDIDAGLDDGAQKTLARLIPRRERRRGSRRTTRVTTMPSLPAHVSRKSLTLSPSLPLLV